MTNDDVLTIEEAAAECGVTVDELFSLLVLEGDLILTDDPGTVTIDNGSPATRSETVSEPHYQVSDAAIESGNIRRLT